MLESYDHRTKTELSSEGGVIPPSPRATLLRLLAAQGALDDDRLIAALSDSRSDVAEAANKLVLPMLGADVSIRTTLIDRIVAREVSAGVAASVLRSEPPLTADQITALEGLVDDQAANWRRASVELLRPHYLSADKIAEYATKLAADSEAEIREVIAERRLNTSK
ncbi:hypothetical protein EOA30_40275 [Mesorhizobium sp. M8A.F.Ca.ET.059.01.1.1]|nr:hypothetical protein EOA30_40275 [Mesorhizobium sp. M8A.F.Ca.ET.059.01.1.1]